MPRTRTHVTFVHKRRLHPHGKTCVPILQNAPAYLECIVRQIINQGCGHAVVILEVVEAVCRERVKPLTMAEAPWEYGG